MTTPVEATERVHIAAWAKLLGPPGPESTASRRAAHVGGLASIVALTLYLSWRIAFTLPVGGSNRAVACALIVFEALPMFGLVAKAITLWNIDSSPSPSPDLLPADTRVVLFIPTYNEPLAVLAPTVAAACALQPSHETWVLDDGDRPWVAEMCLDWGARYVCRPVHDHAKAGNMNHALALLAEERDAGTGGADIVAVVDCDHVPLPHFLEATLGWFIDPEVALVQGPQSFYNAGAFDDDGYTGEQGLFFNVLMPARNHDGAGPFWCGSTSLLRVAALEDVGGVATETITEDMHTTLKLIRRGWKTVYHHQTLAVGLAPETPHQYLLQRRRWGMGAMQILVQEKLWSAKRWMSWRNFHEYLTGTLWWLEGIATLFAFMLPIAVMLTGAETSTASPLAFTVAFSAMFSIRLWGARRQMRQQIHWPTAFALRVFRVPIGMACTWWLFTRRSLTFEVTPKGGSEGRDRGRAPKILWVLSGLVASVLVWASLGVAGVVPWRTSASSTVASGLWLGLAGAVLLFGTRRIRAAQYATSRRNAYRVELPTSVVVDDFSGSLVDVSVGGAAVKFRAGALPQVGLVTVEFPGCAAIKMELVRTRTAGDGSELASLRIVDHDWNGYRTMSLWMFHTPAGAVPELPVGVPVVACLRPTNG
jgi:cellulose synthase (UDP-forming)